MNSEGFAFFHWAGALNRNFQFGPIHGWNSCHGCQWEWNALQARAWAEWVRR